MARTRTRRGKGRSRRKRGGFLGALFGQTSKARPSEFPTKPRHVQSSRPMRHTIGRQNPDPKEYQQMLDKARSDARRLRRTRRGGFSIEPTKQEKRDAKRRAEKLRSLIVQIEKKLGRQLNSLERKIITDKRFREDFIRRGQVRKLHPILQQLLTKYRPTKMR